MASRIGEEGKVVHLPSLHGRYEWLPPESEDCVGGVCISFLARGRADVTVCAASDPDSVLSSSDGREDGAAEYECVIGGWNGTRCALRRLGREVAFRVATVQGKTSARAAGKARASNLPHSSSSSSSSSSPPPSSSSPSSPTSSQVPSSQVPSQVSSNLSSASHHHNHSPETTAPARGTGPAEPGLQPVDEDPLRPLASEYKPYWFAVDESTGLVALGAGRVPGENALLWFHDTDVLGGCTRVGLSSWSHPVSFRGVQVGGPPPGGGLSETAAAVAAGMRPGYSLEARNLRRIQTTPLFTDVVVELATGPRAPGPASRIAVVCHLAVVLSATEPSGRLQGAIRAAADASMSGAGGTLSCELELRDADEVDIAALLLTSWMYAGVVDLSLVPLPAYPGQRATPRQGPSASSDDASTVGGSPRTAEGEGACAAADANASASALRERASSLGGSGADDARAEAAFAELVSVAARIGVSRDRLAAAERHGSVLETSNRAPPLRAAAPALIPIEPGSSDDDSCSGAVSPGGGPPLDLAVDMDDGVVWTSRVLLASYSDVFLRMFNSPMVEARRRRVRIPGGVPAEAMYTLTLLLACPDEAVPRGDPREDVEVLAWVLSLAEQFQIPRAAHLAQNMLSRCVSGDAALRGLAVAEAFQIADVRSKCVALTAETFSASVAGAWSCGDAEAARVAWRPEWCEIPCATARDILAHNRLDVPSEVHALAAALAWARGAAAQAGDAAATTILATAPAASSSSSSSSTLSSSSSTSSTSSSSSSSSTSSERSGMSVEGPDPAIPQGADRAPGTKAMRDDGSSSNASPVLHVRPGVSPLTSPALRSRSPALSDGGMATLLTDGPDDPDGSRAASAVYEACAKELIPCVRFPDLGCAPDAGSIMEAVLAVDPPSAETLAVPAIRAAVAALAAEAGREASATHARIAAAASGVSEKVSAAVSAAAHRAVPDAVLEALTSTLINPPGGKSGAAGTAGESAAGRFAAGVPSFGGATKPAAGAIGDDPTTTTHSVADAVATAVTRVVSAAVSSAIVEAVRGAVAERTTVALIEEIHGGGATSRAVASPAGAAAAAAAAAAATAAAAAATDAAASAAPAAAPITTASAAAALAAASAGAEDAAPADCAAGAGSGGGDSATHPGSPAKELEQKRLWALRRAPRLRVRDTWHEVPFVSGKDAEGAIAWIASRGFSCHYANPHNAGEVAVTCSSPVSRYTRPAALVDRGGARSTSYATGEDAWFAIDLGADRALVCTHYSLTLDRSQGNQIQWWTLQGSQDGEVWVELKRHEGDTRLSYPGQTEAWALERVFPKGCRHYRVQLTPGHRKVQLPRLALSKFEFFGRLRTTNPRRASTAVV